MAEPTDQDQTPRPTARPAARAPRSSDSDAAELAREGAELAQAVGPTLSRSPVLAHAMTSLLAGVVAFVGTGIGGSRAADELKAQIVELRGAITAQGITLAAIQATLQSDHATASAERHEERIRALEGQIADLQKGAWERSKRLDALEKAIERK